MVTIHPDSTSLLLISENPAILSWLRKHLSKDFHLLKTEKEQEALEITYATKLDFILLDSDLEKCNPLALAKHMRQINRIVPIILITGKLKKTYRDMALDAGVSDFLNNELDWDELETRFAIGRKAASEREKASSFSRIIKTTPKLATSQEYLSSKRLLTKEAERMISEAEMKKGNVALLTIQTDHFRELEGEVGMVAADQLQQAVAERLEGILEPNDLLIPYSNGRFILLMQQVNEASARTIAHALQKEVNQKAFSMETRSKFVSISIAISEPKKSGEKYDELINRSIRTLTRADLLANQILSVDKETL